MDIQIKQKTKIGMFWNTFEKFSVQGISFILSIVLARLLTPDDYGTIGLLTVFLSFAGVFIDSGFLKGLIQKQDRSDVDYSTTFIFNLVVSVFLYLVLFMLSPAIAHFYKNDNLVSLERVLFIVLILNSLTIVQNAKLQISVDYKKIALINFISVVISGIISIFFACFGFGVWSLVVQNISRCLVLVVLYWFYGRMNLHTGFSFYSFRKLFGFGSSLLITGIISTLIENVHNLLIGKIYKPSSLGYYTRAQQFPMIVSSTLTSVLSTATFPLMSSLQSDYFDLITTFKKLLKFTAMIIFPAMIGMACISDNLIIVLLGDKWKNASSYMYWLSIAYIFAPLSILNLNLLNSIGRTDLNLKIDLVKVPFIILGIAVTFPISLKAIVIGKTVLCLFSFCIDSYISSKKFSFGPIKQLIYCWRIIIASVIMGMMLMGLNILLTENTLLKLCLSIIAGISLYTFLLFVFREDTIFVFVDKVCRRRK